MNSRAFFFILLILGGVIVFGLTIKPKQELSEIISQNTEENVGATGLSPQIKTMGAVDVEIIPISIDPSKEVVFDLSLNTHSVELNYDYTKIVTLTDEQGNTYKPIRWTGGAGGHHLKGKLVFPPFSKQANELTLTLNGVDNKIEVFNWKL
jgi:hypothetical protein